MDNQNNLSQNRFWNLISKKLVNDATEAELNELDSFLLNNPDLHHQANMMTMMWQQKPKAAGFANDAAYMRHIMKHKDEFFSDERGEQVVGQIEPIEKKSWLRAGSSKRLTVVSFIILILITTGTLYYFSGKRNPASSPIQEISSVVTKNGNRTKIVLPDGSEVWLNAGSNLDYNNSNFNKELREVTLNGEAYFDVTRNPDKPFIIHTKKMDIKVIGTTFNVRSYNDEKTAEASLIKGTIEVTLKDRKDQKIILKPNEKISIANEETNETVSKNEKLPLKTRLVPIPRFEVKELKANPTNNIIPEIAWTQNRLYFEDASLEDIAPMLEKWFGKKVLIQNESLSRIRYTGNFENQSLENVLSYLKLSRSFNFRIENDTVVIY